MWRLNGGFMRDLAVVVVYLAGTLMLLQDRSFAQEQTQRCLPACKGRIALAKEFLRAIYPALKGKNYGVAITDNAPLDFDGDPNWFNVKLFVRPISQPPTTADSNDSTEMVTRSEPLLANFLFDSRSNRLVQFDCFQEVARTETVRETLEKDKNWSDSQALQSLAAAGAKYGPSKKEDIQRLIPFDALTKIMGTLKLQGLRFETRAQGATIFNGREKVPYPSLTWTADIEVVTTKGERSSYTFQIEPFYGQIFLIMENH